MENEGENLTKINWSAVVVERLGDPARLAKKLEVLTGETIGRHAIYMWKKRSHIPPATRALLQAHYPWAFAGTPWDTKTEPQEA